MSTNDCSSKATSSGRHKLFNWLHPARPPTVDPISVTTGDQLSQLLSGRFIIFLIHKSHSSLAPCAGFGCEWRLWREITTDWNWPFGDAHLWRSTASIASVFRIAGRDNATHLIDQRQHAEGHEKRDGNAVPFSFNSANLWFDGFRLRWSFCVHRCLDLDR